MALSDRRAGSVLLALAGAALAAFGALLFLRGSSRPALPGGTGPAPAEAPAPPLPGGVPRPALLFVLRGKVLGPDGKSALPRVELEVVPRGGRRGRTFTDASGEFEWRSEDPTPAVVLWAGVPGCGIGHVFVQGAPGREMRQDVVLVAPRPQSVVVRDGDGAAVLGAEVRVFVGGADAPTFLAGTPGTWTDREGRCSSEVPGGIPLRFLARKVEGALEGETAVETAPGPATAVEIVLRPRPSGGGK